MRSNISPEQVWISGVFGVCNFLSLSPLELTVDCFPGKINDTSIQIRWNNPYTECYSFSVLVDGMVIQNKIRNKSDYTLSHHNSSTQYRVCVVTRDGHGQKCVCVCLCIVFVVCCGCGCFVCVMPFVGVH